MVAYTEVFIIGHCMQQRDKEDEPYLKGTSHQKGGIIISPSPIGLLVQPLDQLCT